MINNFNKCHHILTNIKLLCNFYLDSELDQKKFKNDQNLKLQSKFNIETRQVISDVKI